MDRRNFLAKLGFGLANPVAVPSISPPEKIVVPEIAFPPSPIRSGIWYNGIELTYSKCAIGSWGGERGTRISFAVHAILQVDKLPDKVRSENRELTILYLRHYLTQPKAPLQYNGIIDYPGMENPDGPYPDLDAFQAKYVTPECIEVNWRCLITVR